MHRVIYTCERVEACSQLNSTKFNCCAENLMQRYRIACFRRDILARRTFIADCFPFAQPAAPRMPVFRATNYIRYQPLTNLVTVSSPVVICLIENEKREIIC